MNLTLNFTKSEEISFNSKKLHTVSVKMLMPNGSYSPVPAVFSELSLGDSKDIKALEEIYKSEKWRNSKYLNAIVFDFLNGLNTKFFAVELKGKSPLSERILSLSSAIDETSESVFGEGLQTRPDLMKGAENRPYKGAGAANIYGHFKRVLARKGNFFGFDSTNDEYYKNIKLLPPIDEGSPKGVFKLADITYIGKTQMREFIATFKKQF